MHPSSLRLSASIVAVTALATSSVDAGPSYRTTADAFRAANPGSWRVVNDPVTGNPGFLYGDRIRLASPPAHTAAYDAAARGLIDANPELFGVASEHLETVRVHELKLSRVGSSDKVVVLLRQSIDGLPVLNGTVSILFEAATGDVIAIDTNAVPRAEAAVDLPRSSSEEVLAAAGAAYAGVFGFPFTRVDRIEAVIVGPSPFYGRKNELVARGATLAYLVDVASPGRIGPNGAPAQARVHVSAEGDLAVFKVEFTAHTVDGNVKTNVNLGPEPNTSTNQEQPNLKHAYVRQNSVSGAILATTDANGNFSTGGAGAQTLAVEFEGPFCRTNDATGGEHSVVVSNATTPTSILLNAAMAEFDTAESAAFYHVNEFRDYVRAVDPGDATMDFQVLANVNMSDLLCNAYYDGSSLNLERAGSGCDNTSYQDVVQHEEGHWANNVYNGAVTGAFHEGNADNFAYYINDDPCLTHFNGTLSCLRTALQTSIKKCPNDGDESCHGGEVHLEGQAIASAVWAVRDRLNQTHGDQVGDLIADALFMGWMNAFNDGATLNVIQDHWIALDDDNGTLADLTPNFNDVTGGFGAYSWPVPGPAIQVTQAPAAGAELGHLAPVTIVADIGTPFTLTSASVNYSASSGANGSVAMTPTGNPGEYSATIPGLPSPDLVTWTITAANSGGGTAVYDEHGGPGIPGYYHVGVVVPLFSFDFEGGSDQGWTHVALSGSNGDQFERGNPSGSNESTDPIAAFSGVNVWGTDLSLQGFDGKYEPNGSGELRSPTFNLSGSPKVFLQYRRWLAVEEGQYDQAQIRVNGQVVWANPFSGHVLDDTWVLHTIDISAIAGNNPSVQVAYRLASDGGLEFGGWNIDDFVIYRIDPAPAGFFATYGAGCAGSNGTPALSGSGVPTPGQNVTVSIANGAPNGAAVMLLGLGQASVPTSGCSLLVSGLVGGGFPLPLDGAGAISLPGTIPVNASSGDVYLQAFTIDPGAPNGQYGATNGLQMHLQ